MVKTLSTSVTIVDNKTVKGLCDTNGWGGRRYIYFTAEFSKPFEQYGVYVGGKKNAGKKEAKGEDAKAWISYITNDGEQVEVKVAISAVSQEGADLNLKAEATGKNFDKVLAEAKTKWSEKLSSITVSGGTDDQKKIFYTGLYHNFIAPKP